MKHVAKKISFKHRILRKKRKSGQTMVETMVAMTILGMGLAGNGKVVMVTMKISHSTTDEHVCMQLANNRQERLDQVAFDDIGMWAESNEVVNAQGVSDPNGQFRIDTQLVYPDQTETNYAEVVINIFKRNSTSLQFDLPPKQFVTITTDLDVE